ncbi:MAG: hypothetical protein SangKO_037580 [Sandaracinaceae bacterium]
MVRVTSLPMSSRVARISGSLVVLAGVAVGAAFAAAQPRAVDRGAFAGEWVLASSVPRARERVEAAFELALRDANPLMRAVARTRIDADALVARRIRVEVDGEHIVTTLHTTADHRFRTRLGHPAPVTTETGSEAQLTQLFREGRLELVFDLSEGRRWTVLSLSPGERLTVTTTIDPHRLDDNVRYVLEYRRPRRE